jgi:hypothetical protein
VGLAVSRVTDKGSVQQVERGSGADVQNYVQAGHGSVVLVCFGLLSLWPSCDSVISVVCFMGAVEVGWFPPLIHGRGSSVLTDESGAASVFLGIHPKFITFCFALVPGRGPFFVFAIPRAMARITVCAESCGGVGLFVEKILP